MTFIGCPGTAGVLFWQPLDSLAKSYLNQSARSCSQSNSLLTNWSWRRRSYALASCIIDYSTRLLPLHHRISVLATYRNTSNIVAQSQSYSPQFYIRKSSPQPHSLKLRLVYALRVHTNITKQDITHQYNDTRVKGIRAWHSTIQYNTL